VSLIRIESRSWKSAVAQRTDERSIQPAGIFSINGPCCCGGCASARLTPEQRTNAHGHKNIAECRRSTTETSRLSADGGNLCLPLLSRVLQSTRARARAHTLIASALRQTFDKRPRRGASEQSLVASNAPSAEGQGSCRILQRVTRTSPGIRFIILAPPPFLCRGCSRRSPQKGENEGRLNPRSRLLRIDKIAAKSLSSWTVHRAHEVCGTVG